MNREENAKGSASAVQATGEDAVMPLLLAVRSRERLVGMARAGADEAVLLAPCGDVHTVGLRCALDIAFVDASGVVIESLRDVPPRARRGNRKAVGVIERRSSRRPWFARGDRLMVGIGAVERAESHAGEEAGDA